MTGLLKGFLGAFGGIADMTMKAAGLIETQRQNAWQRRFAGKQFDWKDKQLNIQRHREDTAVQRRMGDLHRAGINPLLAGQMAAGTANIPGSISPPKFQDVSAQYAALSPLQVAQGVMNLMKQKADISMTYAETERIQSQANLNNQRKSHLDISNPLQVKQQLANLTIADKRAVNMSLDSELKKLGVTGAQLDNVRKGLQNKLSKLNLNMLDKDLVLKQMTVDWYRRDPNRSAAPGMPGGKVGLIGDLSRKIGALTGGAIDSIISKFKGKK